MKSLSRVQLFGTLWTVAHQPPPSMGFQARILEWVAISFSRESFQPRDQTQVSCIAGRRFNLWATREALKFDRIYQWGHLGLQFAWYNCFIIIIIVIITNSIPVIVMRFFLFLFSGFCCYFFLDVVCLEFVRFIAIVSFFA